MAIDAEVERIITIGEACRSIPPNGVSPSTFARWLQHGVGPNRTKPETIRIAGRRLTSIEALARFIAAQNENGIPAITAKQRRTQAETSDRLLQQAGL